ncbi:unnamed protein product, partial [Urochloa humidicola]
MDEAALADGVVVGDEIGARGVGVHVEAGEVEEAERVEGLLVGRREAPGPGGGGFEGAEEEVGQACSAAARWFSVRGFLTLLSAVATARGFRGGISGS